jgi:two-component sensor histidine kinase
VAVPRMGVGEKSATTLALIIHELATNSLKYGALSSATAEGAEIVVGCKQHCYQVSEKRHAGCLLLDREPRGGARVDREGWAKVVAPDTAGYGSNLFSRAMASELSGTVERDWSPEGAIIILRMDQTRLAA